MYWARLSDIIDMTSLFLEERLPVGVRMGSSHADRYDVAITKTSGGGEYRKLVHPFPIRSFSINYTMLQADIALKVHGLYNRAFGMLYGFRVKCVDDFTTANDGISAPTAFDSSAIYTGTYGRYQLRKFYGLAGAAPSIGYATRIIRKPVSGTVLTAIGGKQVGNITNTTTGTVDLVLGNDTGNITNITKAANAVVTIGAHTFSVGFPVVFKNVGGMLQINGLRGTIVSKTATTITVDINTASFGTYTSGGEVTTLAQPDEVVTAGCQFDIPCRFNSQLESISLSKDLRDCNTIELMELLNP